MKSLITAFLLTVGIGLGGSSATEKSQIEKGLKPLSEAEMKAIHSRTRTVKWVNAKNNSGTVEYRTDGSGTLNWGTGGAIGKYRIVDNTFCTQWEGVRGGEESCSRVYKTGENEYKSYHINGDLNSVFSYTN